MKGVTERQKAILARWRVELAQAEGELTPQERLEHADELSRFARSFHGPYVPKEPWRYLNLRKSRKHG